MFIHDSHLPQVLDARHYTSADWLQRERDRLFDPGWQFIGTLADLPQEGSFFTFELFEQPLIVWRIDGEVRAFVNVCPHRFSMLSHQPCGIAAERLKCQYHGWEFDAHGDTKKIPDAKSFRPMKRGELGLTPVRVETCGQLVFVNLSDDGPDLSEYLGPGYAEGELLFPADRRLVLSMDYEVACNWKIKIENSLESYHVDFVHQATFGQTPDEADCRHFLEPRWTKFETAQQAVRRVDRLLEKLIHRIAQTERTGLYEHYHYYPNMMYGRVALFSFAETVLPIAPGRTRILGKFFAYPGPPGRLASRLLLRGLRRWGQKFWPKVVEEDTGVMPDIQKGLESNRQPSRGLISIREERIHHFQDWIKRTVEGETGSKNGSQRAARVSCTEAECTASDPLGSEQSDSVPTESALNAAR